MKNKTLKKIMEFLRVIITGDTRTKLIKGCGRDIVDDFELTKQLYDKMDYEKEFIISNNGKTYKVTQIGSFGAIVN